MVGTNGNVNHLATTGTIVNRPFYLHVKHVTFSVDKIKIIMYNLLVKNEKGKQEK